MPDHIATRFARETADHRMTVLHDDGLYRHLRFQEHVWRPPLIDPVPRSFYWFDLITVPGSLIFRGDGESFVFARVEDMFKFFRGPAGRINPGYWSEKLTSAREVRKYDRDIFEQRVKEAFVDAVRDREAPAGLGRAVREQILDPDGLFTDGAGTEESAHQILRDFEFKGFCFSDTWEWDFRDYDWWFLWSLHAIVWGIAQYDAAASPAVREVVATGGVL